jgi:hypothetical protein
MMNSKRIAGFFAVSALILLWTACGGGSGGTGIVNPPPATTYMLSVDSSNPASGVAISVSPSDNSSLGNGSTSFSRTYNAGSTVTLTAPQTASGENFSSWTGCTSASTVTCTVTLGSNTTVTANYATPPPSTYTLTVNSSNPASGVAITVSPSDNSSLGSGSTSFTRTYNAGSTVTLTAPQTAGGENFSSWTGCTSASTVTCTVSLSANTTVTANYATPPPTTYTLTVNSSNPASGVAITVSPSDNSSLGNGSTSFSRTYNAGSTVTLIAPATAGGNNFASWSGCTSASTVTCTVNMSASTLVTASYTTPAPTTYTLLVNSSTPASGVAITVSPNDINSHGNGSTGFSRTYNAGTTVTLIAPTTASGNNFFTWSGCTTASSVTCTVTLNANTTVTADYVAPPPTVYTLTVNSTNPASGVTIADSPSDNNGKSSGITGFTLSYNSGTAVTLTAPATASGNNFSAWSGCASANTESCTVNLTANTTVTAAYTTPNGVTSVSVTPSPSTVTIGATQQFTPQVVGTGSYASTVNWSVAAPAGSSLSPGTISSSGLYTSPYPAPATVTVTATSTQDSSKSGSVTVTLTPPATTAGPALTVDAGNQTHAINPFIYGWNGWSINTTAAMAANITVDRWGGDNTTPYNYLLDVSNSGSDWYFENSTSGGGTKDNSAFNTQVKNDLSIGARTLGSVPLLGYVAKSGSGCSFSVSKYGAQKATGTGSQQQAVDPWNPNCGSGVLANGSKVVNDPTDTYTPIDGTFVGGWVNYLVSKFGTAANGGVAIYDLDNEPSWWDAVHVDEHPVAATYDEMTNSGLAAAKAIKAADSSAAVSGPVMDYWWDYFYSKKDIESGWSSGSCWQPWSNPVDRQAHGGVPFIEYYLQQFAAASATANTRLLDYLDLHTYFAATYNGNGVGLSTAGDTGEQEARLNSTRAFWDPTYTDPNFPQPNYITDANYTSSCNVPLQAPQVIPMMKAWVAKDYPGTKTAITEYNWGGQENINGAVAQADILGIFGREGLDLGTLWGPPDPTTQIPGLMAFEIYRNYDGNKSVFGNEALSSTSANQGQLSVYGALRSSDNAVTVVVINKTYGALTSTLSLPNLTPNGTAKAFLYSNANLNAIVAQPAVTVTPPATGSTTSSIANYSFPAQSITLFVVPKQ